MKDNKNLEHATLADNGDFWQPSMSPHEAYEKLGISEYSERIFHSNSHGELFHLWDYVSIAEAYEGDKEFYKWFPKWFECVVKGAEEKWNRPESVFQHIPAMLDNYFEQYIKTKV